MVDGQAARRPGAGCPGVSLGRRSSSARTRASWRRPQITSGRGVRRSSAPTANLRSPHCGCWEPSTRAGPGFGCGRPGRGWTVDSRGHPAALSGGDSLAVWRRRAHVRGGAHRRPHRRPGLMGRAPHEPMDRHRPNPGSSADDALGAVSRRSPRSPARPAPPCARACAGSSPGWWSTGSPAISSMILNAAVGMYSGWFPGRLSVTLCLMPSRLTCRPVEAPRRERARQRGARPRACA